VRGICGNCTINEQRASSAREVLGGAGAARGEPGDPREAGGAGAHGCGYKPQQHLFVLISEAHFISFTGNEAHFIRLYQYLKHISFLVPETKHILFVCNNI
jgi:hypothetical protein